MHGGVADENLDNSLSLQISLQIIYITMDRIEIKGYKSFKNLTLDLSSINILIGSNGSGKSNFLSFFEFLNRLYEQKLTEYVALNGGLTNIFFKEVF